MKSTTLILIATCAVLTAVAGLQVVRAQAPSLAAGVYTEEQAKRGMGLYKEQCAACHGEDLKGNEVIPALTGDPFVTSWQGKTLGDLFEKISMTMPALNPGSLSPEQTADLIAQILSASKYPAGKTALPSTMDALAQIKIDAPKR
ncbi:MAG: cytochrome c [Acidobacteria bacterium]|nr:cytochrome c [Acidobacteriota bacterium]